MPKDGNNRQQAAGGRQQAASEPELVPDRCRQSLRLSVTASLRRFVSSSLRLFVSSLATLVATLIVVAMAICFFAAAAIRRITAARAGTRVHPARARRRLIRPAAGLGQRHSPGAVPPAAPGSLVQRRQAANHEKPHVARRPRPAIGPAGSSCCPQDLSGNAAAFALSIDPDFVCVDPRSSAVSIRTPQSEIRNRKELAHAAG